MKFTCPTCNSALVYRTVITETISHPITTGGLKGVGCLTKKEKDEIKCASDHTHIIPKDVQYALYDSMGVEKCDRLTVIEKV